jgi:hypothetical protein
MKGIGLALEQMEKEAAAAIQAGTLMTLMLPRRRRNMPRKFPQGELLCKNSDGWNVYTSDPVKVMAWLSANGLTDGPPPSMQAENNN